jgi:hypothetical protein
LGFVVDRDLSGMLVVNVGTWPDADITGAAGEVG